MCTLSWLIEANQYHLFFNRDEQKTRVPCLSLERLSLQNSEVLIPIDPQGGGSWISANEHGVTLCLLNFYQADQVVKRDVVNLQSRGLLLKSLSHVNSIEDVNTFLVEVDLRCYAAFTLIVFELNALQPSCWQWNGERLSSLSVFSPVTSSSVDFERVKAARVAMYPQTVNVDSLKTFHQGHLSPAHQGVCMHREDAQSVSFSYIHAQKNKVQFEYYACSPCQIDDVSKKFSDCITR